MLFVFLVVESNLGFFEMVYKILEKKELNEIVLKNYVVEVILVEKIDKLIVVVKERILIKLVVLSKFKFVDNILK